ncbi:hypothetical protein P280DRAFT_512105 [Massarina eburnea CBS 473.64]|uniref:Uncharacterized protein n=1 Tax=Massarina eburnea CBS 473.64 TaxID=1395130 RepID=A0A6A6RFQ3_9PLEO|nr:hypothetical protein P280DRAFT_512105 [Massarina eburnea CBS 473.64]
MSPRYMCPSTGAIRWPVSQHITVVSNGCTRSFHASARQLEGQSGNGSSGSPPEEPTRRARNATAGARINSLQNHTTSLQDRRPLPRGGGLAGGVFIAGSDPTAESSPSASSASSSSSPAPRARMVPIHKTFAMGPTAGTPGAPAGPPGTMIRAPSKLRITRNSQVGQRAGGVNLRGRGPSSSSRGGQEREPKKREGQANSKNKGTSLADMIEEAKVEDYISDGALQHLLRLQRKEWDRVPYEPKYTQGSLAANELIHMGRELFRGDCPDVKVWGRLEKTIGVVGMHGAHARLKVKRVVDRAEGTAKEARREYFLEDSNRVKRWWRRVEIESAAKQEVPEVTPEAAVMELKA